MVESWIQKVAVAIAVVMNSMAGTVPRAARHMDNAKWGWILATKAQHGSAQWMEHASQTSGVPRVETQKYAV
jgi:hypothetical protein